jgi:flagellin-like protein
MNKWLRNRKAVSPVIAALLLIAISVAAAVITYSWVMTMIEGRARVRWRTIGRSSF